MDVWKKILEYVEEDDISSLLDTVTRIVGTDAPDDEKELFLKGAVDKYMGIEDE